MSKPVGDEQVVPTTFFRASLDSGPGLPRIGDREGRERKGEFEGVSLRRLLDGVEAILWPLTRWVPRSKRWT